MKCPFRTITTEAPLFSNGGTVTTVEFAECHKKECPYYRETVAKSNHPLTGKQTIVISEKCRRANE